MKRNALETLSNLAPSRRNPRMVSPRRRDLVGVTSCAVVRLTNHRRVAVGGGILLGSIQARVHDVVAVSGAIKCSGTATRASAHASHGTTSAIAATGWPVLMLTSCGLGLYQSSAQPGLDPLGHSRLVGGSEETGGVAQVLPHDTSTNRFSGLLHSSQTQGKS